MGERGKVAIDAGGAIVEILLEGELDSWVDYYQLEVTTVRPVDDSTVDMLGGREWNYLVDLSDRTILWREFGGYSGGGEAGVVNGLNELARLLAQ